MPNANTYIHTHTHTHLNPQTHIYNEWYMSVYSYYNIILLHTATDGLERIM